MSYIRSFIRKLTPGKVRIIKGIVGVLVLALCSVGVCLAELYDMECVGILLVVVSLVLIFIFNRCPYCGKFLYRTRASRCPHCYKEQ